MENNRLNSRQKRSKCSSQKIKGLALPLWAWCILIQCWFIVPGVISSCLGVNTSVAIYPEGDIHVRYGDSLEIFCTTEGSSNDIEFRLHNVLLESEKINDTTRKLYVKNPEKQTRIYYCVNKKTFKKCLTRVLVDSPPTDVSDFTCVSKNLEKLNCSWTIPVSYSYNNYSVTFRANGNPIYPSCTVQTTSSHTRSCVWDQHTQPRYRTQEETLYFLITTCNVFGCNKQNYTVNHSSVVKPDPPRNLKVTEIGPHSVVLKWQIPYNMFDLLLDGVEHIIEYQISKIDNITNFHRVDSSSLPRKRREYRFQLNNLPYAYMQYEVRIYIKTNKAVSREYWSDFSYTIFNTASERPNRSPQMIAGAFDQAVWGRRRMIYVYWKQIEEYEEAGANFTYKVQYTQGNKTFPIVFPDKIKSLSYVVISDVSIEALDVYVSSSNTNGSSLTSSHMYIPPKKERDGLSLTSFTKLAYENGTYQLFWDKIDNVDNYTLIWCNHNTTRVCSGRIDFAILDATKTHHIIDLPKEQKYQFAISANKGVSTTGLVWAECDISKDGFAIYRVPAKLRFDALGKSTVSLSWRMGCALHNGLVTGYNVTYCPVAPASGYCDTSHEYKYTYISDPKQMSVVVENLHPFTTYQFSLSLITNFGKKQIEEATAVCTTLEDTPRSPINVQVSDVRSNSLVISWDPPLHSNGFIGKYVIL